MEKIILNIKNEKKEIINNLLIRVLKNEVEQQKNWTEEEARSNAPAYIKNQKAEARKNIINELYNLIEQLENK